MFKLIEMVFDIFLMPMNHKFRGMIWNELTWLSISSIRQNFAFIENLKMSSLCFTLILLYKAFLQNYIFHDKSVETVLNNLVAYRMNGTKKWFTERSIYARTWFTWDKTYTRKDLSQVKYSEICWLMACPTL